MDIKNVYGYILMYVYKRMDGYLFHSVVVWSGLVCLHSDRIEKRGKKLFPWNIGDDDNDDGTTSMEKAEKPCLVIV